MGDHYLQFDYTPEQVLPSRKESFFLIGQNLYYIIQKNEQMYLQACDSVLPFQILYDQGVITGFVWQVDQHIFAYIFHSALS